MFGTVDLAAGPGGATEDKPVGTVFLALAHSGGESIVRERHFRDRGRRINRLVCVLELCDMIYSFLREDNLKTDQGR